MNKIKIYLDTSVISYLDRQDAPERMKTGADRLRLFQNKFFIYKKAGNRSSKSYLLLNVNYNTAGGFSYYCSNSVCNHG